MPDFHLIGYDISIFIALRFNLANRETAIVQFRQRFLQHVMQITLQRGCAFRRTRARRRLMSSGFFCGRVWAERWGWI